MRAAPKCRPVAQAIPKVGLSYTRGHPGFSAECITAGRGPKRRWRAGGFSVGDPIGDHRPKSGLHPQRRETRNDRIGCEGDNRRMTAVGAKPDHQAGWYPRAERPVMTDCVETLKTQSENAILGITCCPVGARETRYGQTRWPVRGFHQNRPTSALPHVGRLSDPTSSSLELERAYRLRHRFSKKCRRYTFLGKDSVKQM